MLKLFNDPPKSHADNARADLASTLRDEICNQKTPGWLNLLVGAVTLIALIIGAIIALNVVMR